MKAYCSLVCTAPARSLLMEYTVLGTSILRWSSNCLITMSHASSVPVRPVPGLQEFDKRFKIRNTSIQTLILVEYNMFISVFSRHQATRKPIDKFCRNIEIKGLILPDHTLNLPFANVYISPCELLVCFFQRFLFNTCVC